MRSLILVLLPLLALFPAAPAAAQEAPADLFTTSAAEIAVSGRLQTLFSTTSVEGAPEALLALRRVRVEFNVRANEFVSAKIQPEFAGGQVSLRDAYLSLHLLPQHEIRVGQAFRPFSLLAQTSSTRILPVERGAVIRGLAEIPYEHHNLVSRLGYSERDVGVQLLGAPAGAPLGLSYAVGVFNGPLRPLDLPDATGQVAARASIRPVEPLRIGAGWSRRDFTYLTGTGEYVPVRGGSAWEVDVEYGAFAPGLHLLGEVSGGVFDPFTESRFRATQLWAGYRTAPLGAALTHLEPVFRVSHGDVDEARGGAGGTLLTPGLNLYFGPLNRVMLNYDFWIPDGDSVTERSFKAMFQMAF